MIGLNRTLAIALEGVGCCAIIAGISVEVNMHADIGFVIITSGSVVVALGGLIFAKVVRK